MRAKTFSIHFGGEVIRAEVLADKSIRLSDFVFETPKLSLTLVESDEVEYTDIELSLEELEGLSKILAQLIDNIKGDKYLNEGRQEGD